MTQKSATTRRLIPFSYLGLFLSCVLIAASVAGAGTPYIVSSTDGTPITYEVQGDGEPTLILVHGWSCDARYWRAQQDVFAARHRVVTVDLAGHGHSGIGRDDYTMHAFGEDVRAVADAVGGDQLILVGHSMGGLVIAEAAGLLQGRVLGLIGVDTLHDLAFPVTEQHAAAMIAPLEADFPTACRQFAASMILPNTDSGLAEWIQVDMASAPARVALSAMREYMAHWITGTGPKLFEELPIPVVVVCADLWPVNVEANLKHMHSFEAIVLEGTDHFLMLDAAENFNKALDEAILKVGSYGQD